MKYRSTLHKIFKYISTVILLSIAGSLAVKGAWGAFGVLIFFIGIFSLQYLVEWYQNKRGLQPLTFFQRFRLHNIGMGIFGVIFISLSAFEFIRVGGDKVAACIALVGGIAGISGCAYGFSKTEDEYMTAGRKNRPDLFEDESK